MQAFIPKKKLRPNCVCNCICLSLYVCLHVSVRAHGVPKVTPVSCGLQCGGEVMSSDQVSVVATQCRLFLQQAAGSGGKEKKCKGSQSLME